MPIAGTAEHDALLPPADEDFESEKAFVTKAKFSIQETSRGIVGGTLLSACVGVLQDTSKLSTPTENTTIVALCMLSSALFFQFIALLCTAWQSQQKQKETAWQASKHEAWRKDSTNFSEDHWQEERRKIRNYRLIRMYSVCVASLCLVVGTALTSVVTQSLVNSETSGKPPQTGLSTP